MEEDSKRLSTREQEVMDRLESVMEHLSTSVHAAVQNLGYQVDYKADSEQISKTIRHVMSEFPGEVGNMTGTPFSEEVLKAAASKYGQQIGSMAAMQFLEKKIELFAKGELDSESMMSPESIMAMTMHAASSALAQGLLMGYAYAQKYGDTYER